METVPHMLQRMSLRTRFVLFSLACLVPLFITVAFFLSRSIDRNTELLINNQFTIASMADRSVSAFITRNVSALESVSINPSVIAMDPSGAETVLGYATTARPEFTSLFLIDDDGTLISPVTNPPDDLVATVSDQIEQTMTNRQVRLSPRITVSEDLTIVIMTIPVISVAETESPSATGTNVAEPDAIDEGATEGETETTPPGHVVGVLGGLMRVDALEQLVIPLARGRTEIAVVRSNEVFLATAGVRRDEAVFVEMNSEPVELAASGETGQFTSEAANGDALIGVFQPTSLEGSSWAILVTNPTPQSYAQSLWQQGIIVLVLGAVMILALAVVLGEITAQPLRVLARRVKAIQEGDFTNRIEPIGGGEIRDLSSAVADMTNQLETQMHGLEESREFRESQTRQMRELLRRTLRLQEAEQRRIAAEIHDAVSPLITGALYQARALQLANGSTPNDEREAALNSVNNLLERATDELHGVIFDLRPPDLDDLGVVAAIQAYVSNIQTMNPTIRLDLRDEPQDLTPEVRLGMYRIVQEALHNVMRHSGADDALVRLESTDDLLRLTIRDNGAGFDPQTAIRPTSLGLLSMRERAAAIGATLTIVSRPGGGAAIILERPHTGNVMSDDVLADLMSIDAARWTEDGAPGDDMSSDGEETPNGESMMHNASRMASHAEGEP